MRRPYFTLSNHHRKKQRRRPPDPLVWLAVVAPGLESEALSPSLTHTLLIIPCHGHGVRLVVEATSRPSQEIPPTPTWRISTDSTAPLLPAHLPGIVAVSGSPQLPWHVLTDMVQRKGRQVTASSSLARSYLVGSRKIFKKIFFYIWSIKYKLIIKLITKLVCKSRDESNEPN